jgi:hypothetical protein
MVGPWTNNYTSVILTFQICLYIDDLPLIEIIKDKLNCGHISISGSNCNFFVNDKASLIQIISPIFNFIKLNSHLARIWLAFGSPLARLWLAFGD